MIRIDKKLYLNNDKNKQLQNIEEEKKYIFEFFITGAVFFVYLHGHT